METNSGSVGLGKFPAAVVRKTVNAFEATLARIFPFGSAQAVNPDESMVEGI
jgi:hypothetical protein